MARLQYFTADGPLDFALPSYFPDRLDAPFDDGLKIPSVGQSLDETVAPRLDSPAARYLAQLREVIDALQ